MSWQRGPLENGDFGEMAYLTEMAELASNRQKRQSVNKNSNEMAKGPFETRLIAKIAKFKRDGKEALWKVAILAKMGYLVKMAEMTINRQNRQIISKNLNDMPKGPF